MKPLPAHAATEFEFETYAREIADNLGHEPIFDEEFAKNAFIKAWDLGYQEGWEHCEEENPPPEEPDISDFPDEVILDYAAYIKGYPLKIDAEGAYMALIEKRPEEYERLCKKIIEEITGKIL